MEICFAREEELDQFSKSAYAEKRRNGKYNSREQSPDTGLSRQRKKHAGKKPAYANGPAAVSS